jgi:prepilin signal peptidase PulO-like enzyme (type II secretory pathway)
LPLGPVIGSWLGVLIRLGRSAAAPLPFGPALALGFFTICLLQGYTGQPDGLPL